MKRSYLAFVLALILLAGCSEPRIDASTDESLRVSAEKVRDSLPEEKRVEFMSALSVLALKGLDFEGLMSGRANSSVEKFETDYINLIDGKTADEVIAAANRITEERKAEERAQAIREINELEEKRERAKQATSESKKIKVLRSRFYIEEGRIRDEPVIELNVKNDLGVAVSRIFFEGTLASPTRSVPWCKGGFNYSIPGGLEPGEEASWSLTPNRMSDWWDANPPADAVLTVVVIRADGADGKPVFDVDEFGDRDKERLRLLKERHMAN